MREVPQLVLRRLVELARGEVRANSLASDMARYITSAIIPVDAGMSGGSYNELEWETPDPRQ